MEGIDPVRSRTRSRGRRPRLPAALLLIGGLAILALLAAPAAGAGPRTIIFDWLASPSWTSLADPITGVGASSDAASDVELTKGDVIFVAGERGNAAGNSDATLIKYKNGVRLWTVDYNGPGNGDDESYQMALSPNGRFVYVAGVAVNAAGNADLVVLKRSAKTGALKWARLYNGPAHLNDVGRTIGVDGLGNVVAGGYGLTATGIDMIVTSYTAAGGRRWVWRHRGPGATVAMLSDTLVSADGSVYVTGYSNGPTMPMAITARLSSRGTKMWLRSYAGPNGLGASLAAVAPRPGGGVYVSGIAAGSGEANGMVLRYSPAGKRKDFVLDSTGAGTSSLLIDVAVASTKHVVAVGQTQAAGNNDCRFVVYRPDGSILGALTFPGAWDDSFEAVATDALGGYYIAGTQHVAATDGKILTVRGSVLPGGGGWYSQWGPTASEYNSPRAIAVRGTTACVVGAYDSGGPTGIDQAVLTYVY